MERIRGRLARAGLLASSTTTATATRRSSPAVSALRRLRMHGGLSEHRAQRALRGLARLRAVRYPTLPITDEIWALRERLTSYDAAYLALAARLEAELVTTDGGLAAVAREHGRLAVLRS